MLACRSCTFSILHNMKETLTLPGPSSQTGPLCLSSLVSYKVSCKIVVMIHSNMTVQIPLPPWREEKEKKIYLWQTIVTWLGGDLMSLWRKWCENPEAMDFALLCSSAISCLCNRKDQGRVTVLEGRKSRVQVFGVARFSKAGVWVRSTASKSCESGTSNCLNLGFIQLIV